jgi:hypothetical protein
MTSVPLHPALVHVPLGLAFALPLLAAGLAVALWRGHVTRRAFLPLVLLQAVLVAGGVLALNSGEREERTVARIVGKAPIHEHEEAAEAFVRASVAALILAAGAAAVAGRTGRALSAATVVATLAVAGLAHRAGKAGGELVYARGAALAYGPPAAGAAPPPRTIAAAKHHEEHE